MGGEKVGEESVLCDSYCSSNRRPLVRFGEAKSGGQKLNKTQPTGSLSTDFLFPAAQRYLRKKVATGPVEHHSRLNAHPVFDAHSRCNNETE